MRILALIPARSGSKGIPNKNIKFLNGKPLIAYTIEKAIKSEAFNRVIVSTDSIEIANIAVSYGADVPFLRPHILADDKSPTLGVVTHAIETLLDMGENYDAVCLLQPTSPLRSIEDISQSIAKFKETHADSLISVISVPHEYNPHWVFEDLDSNGLLSISTGEKEIIARRQDLPNCYIRNGAIYITSIRTLLKERSLYGNMISYYEMNSTNHVNLDTMEDWYKAERIFKRTL